MNRTEIPEQIDQKRWKEQFEGYLTMLNGGALPVSQQPIFRSKQDRNNTFNSSEAAIAAAANSLAALWQVSKLKRRSL